MSEKYASWPKGGANEAPSLAKHSRYLRIIQYPPFTEVPWR